MAAPSITLTRIGTAEAQGAPLWERYLAGVTLLCVAPMLLIVLAVVRILSGRAPLVAHLRVGQFGQPLWVFKVRTMWAGPGKAPVAFVERLKDTQSPALKAGQDPRVTSRFAAFCRRHSLDELPQLWHVAVGSMRFVGPRPMTQAELDQHYAAAQIEVLSVPPGLTGLWQVMGRNRLTYAQRRKLDLFLARHHGTGLNAWVLLRTIAELLCPRHAW